MEKSELERKLESAEFYAKSLEYRIESLEAKAQAYDRLMSGGKKTLKEIANIFGSIVAMDESGRLHLFGMEPKINKNVGEWQPAYRSYHERVPICDIDFTGDWKDSLTLPDSWEVEK
jgi:hypothetical protein